MGLQKQLYLSHIDTLCLPTSVTCPASCRYKRVSPWKLFFQPHLQKLSINMSVLICMRSCRYAAMAPLKRTDAISFGANCISKMGRCLQIKNAGPTRPRSAKLDQRDSLWVTEQAFKIKVKLNIWLHVARKQCFGNLDELSKEGYNTLGNINRSDPLTWKNMGWKIIYGTLMLKKHAWGKTLFAKTLNRWSCGLNIACLICGLNIEISSRKPLQPFDSLPAFRQCF